MERKHIFQNDKEKQDFTSLVNESNSSRITFYAPFQIIIILFELIKSIINYVINPESFENLQSIKIFNAYVSYNELFGIVEVFIILISAGIFVVNLLYKKDLDKYEKIFHRSVWIYGSLLFIASVISTIIDVYVYHEADLTLFYFETLIITAMFYLPPAIIIPEILLGNGVFWFLIAYFHWDSSFSPYKPYCLFLLLGFCSISIFRSQYLLLTMRREEKIKNFQEEAEHRDKLKSMFLANMSHEIRTPMNAIVGMSELALDYNLDSKEKNNLRQIHSSALSLLAIINDILDFSKIESGKMEICDVDFDLLKTVYDVTNVAEVKVAGKDVQLIVEIDPELSAFYNGDDLRLRQILINLVGNAAKFTEKGYIIIRIEKPEGCDSEEGLRFNVIDSGQGIKEDDLKKLFNAFQQVDMKANRTKEGTGLGLSISKNLIQLMGGDIGVKSEYGKGSCFYFNLPFSAVSSEKCGEKYKAIFDKSEENQYHSELRNLPVASLLDNGEFAYLFAEKSDENSFVCPEAKILVVDDNETNLMVAAGLLNKFGVKIETAESGFKALDMTAKTDYDLIFMDHQMPVMDGIETLQKLREAEKNGGKHSVVIALSANAVNGAGEMFLNSGFDDFLPKPIQSKDFARCLKKWLKEELIKEVSGDSEKTDKADHCSVPADFEKPDSSKIDLTAALSFTGNFENWLSAAKTFHKGISQKTADIEGFIAAKDYKNYTIAVHALKSSAKAVGAAELSEKAKELEELGKKIQDAPGGTVESEILSKTVVLLELYKSYLEILKKPVEYGKPQENLQKADDGEIKDLLQQLKAAAESNDLSSAEECVQKLSAIELPDEIKKQLPSLQEAVENIDFDKLREVL